jgi:hypothetical protein
MIFNAMDTDGNGLLDKDEFLKGFGSMMDPTINKDQQVGVHL